MDVTLIVNFILGVSIVLMQVALVLGLLLFIISPKRLNHPAFVWINRYGILLGFLVSLGALIGSLVYSNIIGFAPCDLCWIQRIFLYPQALLFGVALWKKEKTAIVDYSLVLTVVGLIFALNHNILAWTDFSILPCSATVSCTKVYVDIFGYITIPIMSLTTFLVLLALMLIKKYSKHAIQS